MAPLWSMTPSYDGAPAPSGGACGDPVAWLFGFLGVPTPAYATAPPTATPCATPTIGKVGDDATARACADATPIVLAPSGPVTIVLGADVRFAQE